MKYALAICSLLIASSSLGQVPQASIEFEPAEFRHADSARILTVEDGVEIIASNLDPESKYGGLVHVQLDSEPPEEEEPEIDVRASRIIELPDGRATIGLPREWLSEVDEIPRAYRLVGESGSRYLIEAFTSESNRPAELQVTIPGPVDPDPPPPPPPSGDFDDFESLARSLADSVNEPDVRAELAKVYSMTALRGEYPEALAMLETAREDVLRRMGSDGTLDKDWYTGFVRPLFVAIKEAQQDGRLPDGEALEGLSRAVGRGLADDAPAATEFPKLPTVTMLGNSSKWVAEVEPQLIRSGWHVVKSTGEDGLRFIVCAYGQCCEHEGYMTVDAFTKLVKAMANSQVEVIK